MASRAMRTTAVAEANCSRHPRLPQLQRGPSGSMVMCPGSPAMPRHPVPDAAAEHDAAAHAGAERKHEHVIIITRGAQPFFAQRGGVGVVFQHDVRAQPPLDLVAHRVIVPAGKVGRLAQHAGTMSMIPGTPMPMRRSALAAVNLVAELADRLAHLVDDEIASARHLRAGGDLLQQRALLVHGGDAQVGSAQINSNGEGWTWLAF